LLGRHWGIGQKDKNNGALLIVARDEHRLRIEVGYGLEDRLTDAQASVIINQVITPALKAGDFNKGIKDGVAAMLMVLGGKPLEQAKTAYDSGTDDGVSDKDFVERHPLFFIVLVMLFILTLMVLQFLGILPSGGGRGGSSSGGFGGGASGGGFSGGGGSFGGGGASGGW